MRYFVTGATGFIGGELVRQLRAAGHEVAALVRRPEAAGELAQSGVRLHPGDITDRASLRAAMRGADGVFHLAAWYRVGARNRAIAWEINVEGTRDILEVMRELAIPRGVCTSTLAVFSNTRGRIVDESHRHAGPWLSEYDRTKWVAHYEIAEPMIRDGLPLTIVQPGVVYGPGDTSWFRRTVRRYLLRKLPALPRDTGFCFAHVGDTARGHLLAMERGRAGETYIIAGPARRIVDVFDLAERITGIPSPRLRVSPAFWKAMAAAASVVERIIPLTEEWASESLRSSAAVTYWGSSAKAERELGFGVRPLEEGLAETLQHEMQLLGIAPRRSS